MHVLDIQNRLETKELERDPKRFYKAEEGKLLWERQKGLCGLCRRPIFEHTQGEKHHILPHSEGGKTSLDNALLVHPECHIIASNALNLRLEKEKSEKFKKAEDLFSQGDPLAYIKKMHEEGKHLKPGQWAAALALIYERAPKGRPAKKRENILKKDIAANYNTSERSIEKAYSIKRKKPELLEKVMRGELSLSRASNLAKADADFSGE